MTKRILTYVLSLVMIFSLMGCQKDTKSNEETQKEFDAFINKDKK